MKCVICHGEHVASAEVVEEFRSGDDIVCVPIEAPVCADCGERYYDRATMRRIEELRKRVNAHDIPLREVGRVLTCDEDAAHVT